MPLHGTHEQLQMTRMFNKFLSKNLEITPENYYNKYSIDKIEYKIKKFNNLISFLNEILRLVSPSLASSTNIGKILLGACNNGIDALNADSIIEPLALPKNPIYFRPYWSFLSFAKKESPQFKT